MVNFYNYIPTGSYTIYPDQTPERLGQQDSILKIVLVQDLDQSETEFYGTLINSPTEFSPRIIFKALQSQLPEFRGLYTMYTYEGIRTSDVWNLAAAKWEDCLNDWDQSIELDLTLLSTDRAYVSGENTPTITQYTGTNQTGAYITYNS